MATKRNFTVEEAAQVGNDIGVDWNTVNMREFQMGLAVELEHGTRSPSTDVTGDDLHLTAKIALAHLNEFPDYYTRLEVMEKEAESYWESQKVT